MNKTQTIIPDNETHWLQLRSKDITSTEISALFGCSPYSTAFELWHIKRQELTLALEPNERMLWGTRLQDAIAGGLGDDQGWHLRKVPEYMREPELRMGSSFDFFIGEDGILEVKNVDSLAFRNGWLMDGDSVEAPPHIELQIQHQLAVSGRKFAYIGALVGGNRAVLLKREPDPEIASSIRSQIKQFWHSIKEGLPPAPDFEKDAQFISQLYSQAEPGKLLDARKDSSLALLGVGYRSLGEQIKDLEAKRDGVKAQILMAIGDHEKVLGENFTIAANVVPPARVEYDRKAYRQFRVNWKTK